MTWSRELWRTTAVTLLALGCAGVATAQEAPGPFVQALWFFQRHGRAGAVSPEQDARFKGLLAKAIGKQGVIDGSKVQSLIDGAVLARLTGDDNTLDPSEVQRCLEADMPKSRTQLLPEVVSHLDGLTTSFDMIDPVHREAGGKLADWVVTNYRAGEPLHVIVICTGNSRRSILGSTLGNMAAAYYGMPEIRFYSGGTEPSAFNPRTIRALEEIGVVIEPTGEEASRGPEGANNPLYRVRWGQSGSDSFQAVEFSKRYDDPANPASGFAALLVCGEADAGCPVVKGAASRISMPYLDPKIYDNSRFEAMKYAERRDDMGRLMLSVMCQVRNRLGTEKDFR